MIKTGKTFSSGQYNFCITELVWVRHFIMKCLTEFTNCITQIKLSYRDLSKCITENSICLSHYIMSYRMKLNVLPSFAECLTQVKTSYRVIQDILQGNYKWCGQSNQCTYSSNWSTKQRQVSVVNIHRSLV